MMSMSRRRGVVGLLCDTTREYFFLAHNFRFLFEQSDDYYLKNMNSLLLVVSQNKKKVESRKTTTLMDHNDVEPSSSQGSIIKAPAGVVLLFIKILLLCIEKSNNQQLSMQVKRVASSIVRRGRNRTIKMETETTRCTTASSKGVNAQQSSSSLPTAVLVGLRQVLAGGDRNRYWRQAEAYTQYYVARENQRTTVRNILGVLEQLQQQPSRRRGDGSRRKAIL